MYSWRRESRMRQLAPAALLLAVLVGDAQAQNQTPSSSDYVWFEPVAFQLGVAGDGVALNGHTASRLHSHRDGYVFRDHRNAFSVWYPVGVPLKVSASDHYRVWHTYRN